MRKDSQWYQDRAQERREREAGRRSYQINRYRRDLEDLERLKRQLLRKMVSNPRRASENTPAIKTN